MTPHLIWGIVCLSLVLPVLLASKDGPKLRRKDVKKIEIGFDLSEGKALIVYNDAWKSSGKIFYADKKKVVAYRDEEMGHCLLEKIKKYNELKNGDGDLHSRMYHISEFSMGKVKAEELAGKRLANFCGHYPISLLKELDDNEKYEKSRGIRGKRESDAVRGNESHLSHQEISKKLLEDLAVADGLVSKGIFSSKGVKRNANGGIDRVNHPSATAKVGQPATVDYHARISNNLPPGSHPIHPIDITSSVTIATGSSHPVWAYSPSAGSHYAQNGTENGQGVHLSHGIPYHSSAQLPNLHPNTTQLHHPGQHYLPEINGQTDHHGAATHPSSSGRSFKNAGYYPPSSSSKSQGNGHYPPSSVSKASSNIPQYPPSSSSKSQSNVHYPPSSVSKTSSNSPQYPPSSFSKSEHGTPYYPPSSASKPQHIPAHYAPSSVSKSQGPSFYPPSSSSKSHLPSSSHVPQPGPSYYPPSAFSKTHHNITSGGHGIHLSSAGNAPGISQHPSGSHSSHHGYRPSYVPPSSTSKIHHSAPQPHNGSHTLFNKGGIDPGRGIYAPQFPPSSTSKVYHPPVQYGAGGSSGISQYPPSSTSKLHHVTPNGGHGGSQDHLHGNAYYPPSSGSKIAQTYGYYAPQFPPSSTSKINPDGRNSFYDHTSVLERPGIRSNGHESDSYPPSSTSKIHYPQHGHIVHPNRNTHGVQYYPPSSSSKVNFPPSSSDKTQHTYPSYPPSSTSKMHPSPSANGVPPVQIPQPPTDRNIMNGFPPSSASKSHATPSHPPQYFPPSSSNKVPQGSGFQPGHNQHHQSPGYYPPSSPSRHHQNTTSTKTLSPGYYSPSSPSNHHHPDDHQKIGGRITATGRVSVTPGFGYYPPSSSSKNTFSHQNVHGSSGHPVQQYPFYGPSASSQHHNSSISPGYSGMTPLSSDHTPHSQSYIPPSSTSKIHPNQQNASTVDPNIHSKPLYPEEQRPSSGGQHYPFHRNDSSPGHFSQGGYYPPNGHHSSAGSGYVPQYPPSSSSHHPQQSPGGNQHQIYQGVSPSGQGSPAITGPCQSISRSLYSITTRTILTPNGAIQRPASVKTNGEYPCGAGSVPGGFPYARYAPCSGTLTRNGQSVRSQTPCTANGNLRKNMRNVVPGPAVIPQYSGSNHNVRTGSEQNFRGYGSSSGLVTNIETQTELLHGYHHGFQFSKLKAAENSTSEATTDETTAPERFEENGRNGKDVEVFERNEAEDEKHRSQGKPVKYQENEEADKAEDGTKSASEEEVKEGDVLEPGDTILGKDGYTILDGFRGRVVSVTGQIGKTRSETGKVTNQPEVEKKSNSGQFKYSTELGRYVKENGEKNYSNCQGEPTFTCSEFLRSNGRAKICKPNPRRNPDGSPC